MMPKDKVQSSKFNVQRASFNVQRVKFNVQRALFNVKRAKFKEKKRRDSQRASALLVCLTKKSFQMKGNLTVTFVILDQSLNFYLNKITKNLNLLLLT